MAPVQDGRALVSGVVKAEDQRAEIGEGTRRESGSVPLTPAQARAMHAENRWPDDPEPPPGYTHHKVEVRTDRELAEQARRESDAPAPERNAAVGSARSAQAAVAVSVIRDFRAHVDKVRARAEAARGGTPEERAAAVDEIRKTKELGATIRDRLEATL